MRANKEEKIKTIMKRKEDHLNICLSKPVQAKKTRTLFECVHLFNNSLPEMDFDKIDTSTTFLGHDFSAPIMAGAMTGGSGIAEKINKNIAIAVEELGLGMVVGSQRAGLYDKSLEKTYSVAREYAPTAFIGSNVGGGQLSAGFSLAECKRLLEMLGADAFYVHLNPLQEALQPEGEPKYKNVVARIAEIAESIDKPVVVKEVGCGISGEAAKKLEGAGVKAIEVAGVGGTSYSAVEYYRAEEQKMHIKARVSELFWDWGIPTAAALYMARKSVKIPIVASGGIRNGQEIAKALAMGANLCATAWPLLKPATISSEKVKEKFEEMIYTLKVTMFVTGCKNIKELGRLRYATTGDLSDFISASREI